MEKLIYNLAMVRSKKYLTNKYSADWYRKFSDKSKKRFSAKNKVENYPEYSSAVLTLRFVSVIKFLDISSLLCYNFIGYLTGVTPK